MCTTCGCSDDAKTTVTNLESGSVSTISEHDHTHDHNHDHEHPHDHTHSHDHSHDHGHSHDHEHPHDHTHSHDHSPDHAHNHAQAHGTTIQLEEEILAKNNLLAERNRGWFEGRNILALNLVSSPGSGKTTLLQKTITDLKQDLPINVIEGDQETTNDAQRIKETGCKVVQINTGTGCHLEADMLERGLKELQPPTDSVVMIENVGNLVCPALFDLGERHKVAILSVTEGEDKPIKYPHMFRASDIMLLNKIDLLPHLNFDVEACIQHAQSVNPNIKVFQVSATTGEGMETWYKWIRNQVSNTQLDSIAVPYKEANKSA
tara:strand:+ start:1213 stop:2169 length:957 start_codon:yes stop_codon:yes gene_type:complete